MIHDFPIVLYGRSFFQPLMEAIDAMVAAGTVSPIDKKLLFLTDDMDEAMHHIETYVRKNFTIKPRKRLWWLLEKR